MCIDSSSLTSWSCVHVVLWACLHLRCVSVHVCVCVNDVTHNELLEVPQDVSIVNVEDVAFLLDHDVVVMAISEALRAQE